MDGFYDQQVPYMVTNVSDQLKSCCFNLGGGRAEDKVGGGRRGCCGEKGSAAFLCPAGEVELLLTNSPFSPKDQNLGRMKKTNHIFRIGGSREKL